MLSPLRKNELADLYPISQSYLRRLMNVVYYKELQEVGYNKYCITLNPKVIRKFFELYGEPLNENELEIN
ncbi:hypothetical protein [Lishizhenia sp.]|uniref:hypothetical protein n=1 Tax=Lishizhenia sp. TaxID=2497594 RepID=UPI00299ED1C7|nr:hypothetical protein [Lishizhenia sp.]MDX1447217.1 hypothetical protein [Lishizhenia sp.]